MAEVSGMPERYLCNEDGGCQLVMMKEEDASFAPVRLCQEPSKQMP